MEEWRLSGKYSVGKKIGTGSYGFVSDGIQTSTGAPVAIKRIAKVFDDLIDCKRILREVSILSKLDHPNVVKLVDVIIPGNERSFEELYIVLELCDLDLRKLFKTEVYLTEQHVKTLMYNLILGINYIHSAGIYHRDMKPANCLVNRIDCSIKICDFGLSRAVGMECVPSDMCRTPDSNDEDPATLLMKRQLTGHVVTRWYRSPELILLEEGYTEAIDIWSVGCIFAELLGMIKENVPVFTDREPLFPGGSCFPLSPNHKDNDPYSRGMSDQLNLIFNVLGTPTDDDMQSIMQDDARRYIRCFKERSGTGLKSKLKLESAAAINMLTSMLIFDHKQRITGESLISHPYLDDVRRPNVNSNVIEPVFLPFELEHELSERELRMYFVKESRKYDTASYPVPLSYN